MRTTPSVDARQHGPLPGFLIVLTVVTGLVDAFSYLELGRVFVANMTGNVIFLGFALARVGDISVTASLLALLAFATGAVLGGRFAARRRPHRGRLLATGAAAQATLVVIGAAVAVTGGVHATPVRLVLIGLLAVAMGCQNAVVLRLAVPDLTTTVLTRTLAGLAAGDAPPAVRRRRAVAVVAMLGGALIGGALLRWTATSAPLWVAGAALATCAVGAHVAARRTGSETWR